MLYKGLKGKARIPTDDLIPKNRRCRNEHSFAFQIPSASKEAYKSSFFPQAIRDWNDLPDSLISSAEMSDDCCVQVRFTRAFKGLISPPSEPPGEIMSFGVSPVNYSELPMFIFYTANCSSMYSQDLKLLKSGCSLDQEQPNCSKLYQVLFLLLDDK